MDQFFHFFKNNERGPIYILTRLPFQYSPNRFSIFELKFSPFETEPLSNSSYIFNEHITLTLYTNMVKLNRNPNLSISCMLISLYYFHQARHCSYSRMMGKLCFFENTQFLTIEANTITVKLSHQQFLLSILIKPLSQDYLTLIFSLLHCNNMSNISLILLLTILLDLLFDSNFKPITMQEPLVIAYDSIDSLLQNRIGFGPGQQKLIRSLYILLFAQGCETVVLGLLLPKLGHQWNLDKFDKSLLITMVYLGVSIGSYLETLSDKYGRYKFLLADALITSFFGLLSCFCTSFNFFVVVRFCYGVGIGIALPLTATYITEVVPGSHRARILSVSRIYWSLGCLFACIAGWILLINNHWRLLLLILCFPSFYAIYDIVNNGRESLRYLWARGDLQNCEKILGMIIKQNNVKPVSFQQLGQIMERERKEEKTNSQGSFSILFNEKYLKQTLILCFSWITACFLYYSVMLMLPSILSRNRAFSQNFQYVFLIVITCFETIAFYGAKIVMDHPEFGRKKSVYLGYSFIFILSLLIIIFGQSNRAFLMIVFVGLKIFATGCFMILYPYSAEIYETLVRSQAMGIFSVCGRLATTFLGIIGISALQWANGKGLYYIFVFLALLTSVLIYKMPYCTLGRKLDT